MNQIVKWRWLSFLLLIPFFASVVILSANSVYIGIIFATWFIALVAYGKYKDALQNRR
jgi:hypothetical protein